MDTRDNRGAALSNRNGIESESLDDTGTLAGSPRVVRAALTKEELQNLLVHEIGLTKRECREMVNTVFEEIRLALESGDPVKLEGFGRFQPRERPKRWARNLRSGERISVSERRIVTFHPSRKLTDHIQRHPPARGKSRL